MIELLFFRLPSNCVHPTNLLPTGVIITSNYLHRRLLSTEVLRSSNQKHTRPRSEPSFLSNQPFAFKGAGFDFFFIYLNATKTKKAGRLCPACESRIGCGGQI